MKLKTKISIAIIAVLCLLVYYICWGTDILSDSYEIDLNSGQIRQSKYFVGMCFWQNTKETSLSEIILKNKLKRKKEEWVSLSTRGVSQERYISNLWRRESFDYDAKHRIASYLLELWAYEGGEMVAHEFIREIMRIEISEKKREWKVKDIFTIIEKSSRKYIP